MGEKSQTRQKSLTERNTDLTSPLASTTLPAPTAETSFDPSLLLVQGPLSPLFKCCLPHPLRIASTIDEEEEEGDTSTTRGGNICPLYRSFSHNSTCRISEFQHSSVSLSLSINRWMITVIGSRCAGSDPPSISTCASNGW